VFANNAISGPGRVTPAEVVAVLEGDGGAALGKFLRRQRWFAAKARGLDAVRIEDWGVLDQRGPLLLALLDVDGERYYLPLAVSASAADGDAIARVGSRMVGDGHADPAFGRRMLEAISAGREITGQAGSFRCRPMMPWAGPGGRDAAAIDVQRLSGEQSNTSIALGRELILKSLRRPRPGVNPEVEITQFLTARRFPHVPRLVGWMDHAAADGESATVCVLQGFVDNDGDGWRHVLHALGRAVDSLASRPADARDTRQASPDDPLVREMRELGRVTGALHAALASDAVDPAFAPEPVTAEDARRWESGIAAALDRASSNAARSGPELARALRDVTAGGDGTLAIRAGLDLLAAAGAHKIRCHGDYHLGQVLKTRDSFVVIDFEGEPGRPIAERRAKHSPLRDVAGMLRSLNYAVNHVGREGEIGNRAQAALWLESWERLARNAFLDGYASAARRSPVRLVPPSRDELLRACAPFEIDKACYELAYELDNRPDWVAIPLAGLSRLLERR
jgi:maltose alpha-D-glucosyltransferase/alpha-amylase